MINESHLAACYHCGIDELLKVAYGRDFSMLEMGKCKSTYPDAIDWYATLSPEQRVAVDEYVKGKY